MTQTHAFTANISWQPLGQPFTYKEYSRQYLIRIAGKVDIIATSAPAFLGSEYHHNPEDLLVAAVASCHMLTYLAVAASSKMTVLSYEDQAEGTLSNESGVFKFRDIVLKPKITFAPGTDTGKAEALHEKAHKNCFIASSVNFPVTVAGQIRVTPVIG